MVITLDDYFGLYLGLMSSVLCMVLSWRVTHTEHTIDLEIFVL